MIGGKKKGGERGREKERFTWAYFFVVPVNLRKKFVAEGTEPFWA